MQSVTHGKTTGQGLELVQVRETMRKYNGQFTLFSEQNIGTKLFYRLS